MLTIMVSDGNAHVIKSVTRTWEILEAMKRHKGKVGVSELSKRVGLSPGAVHRHLSTLLECGLITKEGHQYALSLKFLQFGDHVRNQSQIYRIAKRQLDKLVTQHGLLVHMLVEEGGQGVYLYDRINSISPNHSILGVHEPLHVSSAGKAILAHMNSETRDSVIEQQGLPEWTKNTIVDYEDLLRELEKIREDGVAYNDQEAYLGHRAIGTAVLNSKGEPVCGISISDSAERFNEEEIFGEVRQLLLEASSNIEMNYQLSN